MFRHLVLDVTNIAGNFCSKLISQTVVLIVIFVVKMITISVLISKDNFVLNEVLKNSHTHYVRNIHAYHKGV